jgi:hypothetical protein
MTLPLNENFTPPQHSPIPFWFGIYYYVTNKLQGELDCDLDTAAYYSMVKTKLFQYLSTGKK